MKPFRQTSKRLLVGAMAVAFLGAFSPTAFAHVGYGHGYHGFIRKNVIVVNPYRGAYRGNQPCHINSGRYYRNRGYRPVSYFNGYGNGYGSANRPHSNLFFGYSN